MPAIKPYITVTPDQALPGLEPPGGVSALLFEYGGWAMYDSSDHEEAFGCMQRHGNTLAHIDCGSDSEFPAWTVGMRYGLRRYSEAPGVTCLDCGEVLSKHDWLVFVAAYRLLNMP
jgi:hypothetical protein